MKHEYLYIALTALAVAFIILALTSCAGDRFKGDAPLNREQERNAIVKQGQDFCQKYPDDVACPGPGVRK